MVKCSFCKKEIAEGKGKMYVPLDGRIAYFCSRRCEKNVRKLKRDSKKLGWIKKTNKTAKKK